MSSTVASVGPSSASSSPSVTPSSSPLFNTSTLLFGFLVSALSLFGVFMTFAIVWNRLIARRRAIEAMMGLGSSTGNSRALRRPHMWDVWVIADKQPLQWHDVKPLAAAQCNLPENLPRTSRPEHVPFWKRHLLVKLTLEITYLFHPPIPPVIPPSDTDVSTTELPDGSDINVSVLISMPRAPATREREDENSHPLHELVLATTSVVCYHHDPTLSQDEL